MGNIEAYRNGRILTGIGKALQMLGKSEAFLEETPEALELKKKICAFEPLAVSIETASDFLRDARRIAIGERVCRSLHPESTFTESVFLDELGEAMIEAGHARAATADEALDTLRAHGPGHPLVLSKVSGRYLEICASSPESCVFWQAEKKGMRCLKRGSR